MKGVLCQGCDYKSQRYSSITAFIWEICTHAVCQGKGRSQWRRISPQRSAKRSQTPPLWFCHSDTGCRGKTRHISASCNPGVIRSTGFTTVFTVVPPLAWKIIRVMYWGFSAEGKERQRPGSRMWKYAVTFICLMYYIITPAGWESLLMICNLVLHSWDGSFSSFTDPHDFSHVTLCAATAGSGGESLMTFAYVLECWVKVWGI